ncbi:Serine/threonine protein kinase PrkC, regulator of stationary phase [Frigoriglobus tundricola]|uniref:non-specific serine/threonine protein kinase n=1 Tax=Frigoriglobus tundricola TaxID=2774151 RepID=A0A6M5YXL9_9BACT|nr:Serine/threonine protein kinase PrkC, regulator of stationary phase [Frigoriglobus tundricola]
MAGGPVPARHERLSVRALLGIEVVCDAFERELRAGRSPDWRAYLARGDGTNREALRAELVALDLTYRREHRTPAGARPEPAAEHGAGPPFTILRELGRGGMGVVYLALDPRLGRHVALKLLREGGVAAPDHVRRFLAEAQAVARMPHPNIVSVFEVGESGGVPFLVLEFVTGGTLAQWAAGRAVPPLQAAVLVEQVARAAHYAHEKGIVHRDIKPQNVLLALDGPEGPVVPKLTDFGLAKLLDSGTEETPTGAVLGTPAYMAPEQVRPDVGAIGPRTDVYALGATLYALLTGGPPFRAATPLATVAQVVADPPVPPRKTRPELPADLEAVCLKCLEKDPARRYATAEELAADLARFRTGRPTRARPVGWTGSAWRTVRRKRRAVATALGAALAAGAAFAVAWSVAPGPVAPGSPDKRADLLRDLDKGEPVELIGDGGEPHWYRWRGMASTLGRSQFGGPSVVFQTTKTTGLELVPDPRRDRYRVTAELRHLTLSSEADEHRKEVGVGRVGLFLAAQSDDCPDGTRFDRYLLLWYTDFLTQRGRPDQRRFACEDRLLAYRKNGPQSDQTIFVEFLFDAWYKVPPNGVGFPSPWRRIVADVSPGGVRVSFESQTGADDPWTVLSQWTVRKEDLRKARSGHENNPKAKTDYPEVVRRLATWSPRMPIGIVASNSAVEVRRVAIEPQPAGGDNAH